MHYLNLKKNSFSKSWGKIVFGKCKKKKKVFFSQNHGFKITKNKSRFEKVVLVNKKNTAISN